MRDKEFQKAYQIIEAQEKTLRASLQKEQQLLQDSKQIQEESERLLFYQTTNAAQQHNEQFKRDAGRDERKRINLLQLEPAPLRNEAQQ